MPQMARNMRQNLAFALIYNALGIPLAAGLLYTVTGQPLSPMIAALAMSLGSVSVITNALRLRGTSRRKLQCSSRQKGQARPLQFSNER